MAYAGSWIYGLAADSYCVMSNASIHFLSLSLPWPVASWQFRNSPRVSDIQVCRHDHVNMAKPSAMVDQGGELDLAANRSLSETEDTKSWRWHSVLSRYSVGTVRTARSIVFVFWVS